MMNLENRENRLDRKHDLFRRWKLRLGKRLHDHGSNRALFLRRFLQRPMRVASIIPSSRTLTRRVANHMDLTQPRVIVEFGAGEGCHSREILARMHPASHLILFELDPKLARHLSRQFHGDPRVTVLNADCATLIPELARRGHASCDYIVSGIPFSLLHPTKKYELLRHTFDALASNPTSAFIIYQTTNELLAHCRHFFRAESRYCLQNFPPMFVAKFHKTAAA